MEPPRLVINELQDLKTRNGFRAIGTPPAPQEIFPELQGKAHAVSLYFSGTVIYPILPLLTSLTRSTAPPSFAA